MDINDLQDDLQTKVDLNSEEVKQKEEELKQIASKYDGMDEVSLTSELFRNVQEAKESGSFNYTELLSFANTMFPYLSEEQREKLVELLKMIGGE